MKPKHRAKLNLLVLLNEKSKWEAVVNAINECVVNTEVLTYTHEPSSVFGYIASKKPDAVVFCSEEKNGYDPEANILLEIRRMNPELPIALLSLTSDKSFYRIGLECEAEWCLGSAEDSDMLALLMQRLEKRVGLQNRRKEERINSILIDLLKNERQVSYQDRSTLFQNYPMAPFYQVSIIKILPPYRRRAVADNDNLVILKGREILNENLSDFSNINFLECGHDLIVVAGGENAELLRARARLMDFLVDMKSFSQSISAVAAWVYMGIVVADIQELPLSYKSAHDMRDERLIQNRSGLLIAKSGNETAGQNDDGRMQVFDVRKSLSNALATFDKQLVHKSLAQLKSNLLSSAEISGRGYFEIYRTLSASLVYELERKEIDLSENGVDYDSLIREFDYFWDVDDVFNALEEAYVTGVDELQYSEERDAPTQIVLAKRYIRAYFDMPLSLSELSDYVGLNENYFSEYFKKQAGMNFKEYQTDLRIRHAKQMLLDKHYSMKDISDAVGYKDTKYFSRVFKQKTGLAPGEYRKKYHVIND